MNIACPEAREFSVSGTTVKIGGKQIKFELLNRQHQERLLKGEYSMRLIPSFDQRILVPVALRPDSKFAEMDGDTLVLHADVITLSFALLSRFEETMTKRRDRYNRYSYQESLAKAYKCIGFPIVDEYAFLLRSHIGLLLPRATMSSRKAKIVPTHDIDNVRRFGGAMRAYMSIIGGDLLLRRNLKTAADSVKEYIRCRGVPELDPEILACDRLIDVSKRHRLSSIFYLMGCGREEPGFRYDVTKVDFLARAIRDSGMRIGFHGGLETCEDSGLFLRQKTRVEHVVGLEISHGRQHYLCFDAIKSPLIWEQNGITHDSTLGYFDHEGFMCGTCHEYPLFDIANDIQLQVKEKPLLFMDQTAFSYRMFNTEQTLASLFALYERVQAVEGDLVMLWHNTSVHREYHVWFEGVYVPFIESVCRTSH